MDELVKQCRDCIDCLCGECKYEHLQKPGNFVPCMNALLGEAADVIEELSKASEGGDYIDREAIQKRLNRIVEVNNLRMDLAWFTPYGVKALIEEIPAADVRPVKKGRWIRHYEQADTGEDIITYPCGWVCSECGRWESDDEPFCNCGADMREES